jgi:hypothetical protein
LNPRHQAWEACALPLSYARTRHRDARNVTEREGAVKGRTLPPRRLSAVSWQRGNWHHCPDPQSLLRIGRGPLYWVHERVGKNREGANRSEYLYFFPDQKVTADEIRQMLRQGTSDQRAWVISHLLRYAQWDDIWAYVSRDEVKEIFPTIDLPENLRLAWARMLKIEAPVG